MATKRPEPTFIVRFVADAISPAKIPWRAVSEALSAVQDLASGRNPLETRAVPPEKSISLFTVRKGSAVYSCISNDPPSARRNLGAVRRVLSNDIASRSEHDDSLDDELVRALKPIERLSDVAKLVDCRLEVALANKSREPLFTIQKDDYARISDRLFIEGDTTIIGTVKRVGGQTKPKCALTIPGRQHLLYCDVQAVTPDVIRELGKHLYEDIAAQGTAVWIHSTWYIHKFTIRSFTQPRLGNVKRTITKLRSAGLSAWDKVDIDTAIEELRS